MLLLGTVFISFAFGTAAGDMTAGTLELGNFWSGILGGRLLAWNNVFCFWFAYVMTRPLGASFADWVGKPQHKGQSRLWDHLVRDHPDRPHRPRGLFYGNAHLERHEKIVV